jgi:hypothetical protein
MVYVVLVPLYAFSISVAIRRNENPRITRATVVYFITDEKVIQRDHKNAYEVELVFSLIHEEVNNQPVNQ